MEQGNQRVQVKEILQVIWEIGSKSFLNIIKMVNNILEGTKKFLQTKAWKNYSNWQRRTKKLKQKVNPFIIEDTVKPPKVLKDMTKIMTFWYN